MTLQRIVRRAERELSQAWQVTGSLRCPVCGSNVRAFQPIAASFLEHWRIHGFDLDQQRFETLDIEAYHCPKCSATDRDRLYALYIDEFARSAPPRGTAIEFAPSGPLTARLRAALPGWRHRTADLYMANVEDKVDLCDMREQYPDASVDFFICSHVLEHVADDRAALRELNRMLKPGSEGIIMVPLHLDLQETRSVAQSATTAERWRHVGQDDHVRLHAIADFRSRVEGAGLQLRSLGEQHFTADRMRLNGIKPSSVLHIGRKPSNSAADPTRGPSSALPVPRG